MKKSLVYFFLFIFFFAGSYLFFSSGFSFNPLKSTLYKKPSVAPVEELRGVEVATKEKSEECPLNGGYFTSSDKALWDKRRPLGIMIENSPDSRPQSGLSNADVVFEAVAEGGITRFLAMFYCQDASIVGPVRSARVYFMDMIGGFGHYPLYAHVGGANTPGPANALGQLEDMGWALYNDLNQFSIGFPVFWRDYERLPGVATEHTMYSNTTKLWDIAKKRDLTNVDEEGVKWNEEFTPWLFKKAKPSVKKGATTISYGFWDTMKSSDVKWVYDKETNTYKRTNAGKAHNDKNTGKQLSPRNVVVVFMDESVANDGYDQGQHMLYETEGEGEALIFQEGGVVEGTWEKEDRETMIRFFNEDGDEIEFNRGQVWVSILPIGNKVTYR